MSGVATTDHGLEWGDGWTVIQPLNVFNRTDLQAGSDADIANYTMLTADEATNGVGASPSDYPYLLNCSYSPAQSQCCEGRCSVGSVGVATASGGQTVGGVCESCTDSTFQGSGASQWSASVGT